MRTAEIKRRLLQLAQQHPGAHPYTLALHLQNDAGWMVSGQYARDLPQQARREQSPHNAAQGS